MALGIEVVILGIVLFVILALVLWFVGVYNGLVRLKNNIRKSWSNIDVLLTQRADELPKLIKTVKGYMKHEKETLQRVTEARTKFLNAQNMSQKAEADNLLSGALKSLFAVAESYPDLKANDSFKQLQNRISGLENEIADRREFYNDSVNQYNIRIQSVPDNMVAGMLKYREEELFEAEKGKREDVDIDFSDV